MSMFLRQIIRLVAPPVAGAAIALALFWFMQYLIAASDEPEQAEVPRYQVEMVEVKDEPPPPEERDEPPKLEEAVAEAKNVPNPVPSMSTPAPTGAPVSTGDLSLNDVDIGFEFDGGLGGGLVGIAGLGGKGEAGSGKRPFSGRPITPVSTGRPQCPEYAVDNKIEGWVDLLFVVDKSGQVHNPRVLNASPRGVFEVSAIEAVMTWQYSRKDMAGNAREVKQRVDYKLKDCAMDWRTRR